VIGTREEGDKKHRKHSGSPYLRNGLSAKPLQNAYSARYVGLAGSGLGGRRQKF